VVLPQQSAEDMAHAENKPMVIIVIYESSSHPSDLAIDLEYYMDDIPDLEADETKQPDAKSPSLRKNSFSSKVEEAATAATEILTRIIRLREAERKYQKDETLRQDSTGAAAQGAPIVKVGCLYTRKPSRAYIFARCLAKRRWPTNWEVVILRKDILSSSSWHRRLQDSYRIAG